MADTYFAVDGLSWAVRFRVWWHLSVGEQAVFRVVTLGYVH